MICTVIRSTRTKYKLHFKLDCKLHLHLQTTVEMDIITQRTAECRPEYPPGYIAALFLCENQRRRRER